MNILQSFKTDKMEPQERFAHLDGSPYGSRSLKRLLMTPATQGFVVVAAFAATAQELLKPDHNFLWQVVGELGPSTLIYAERMWWFNRNSPVSKDAVIDKSGRTVNDPAASIKVQGHYRDCALLNLAIAATAAALICCTTGDAPFIALNNLVFTAWAWYANRKLATQKWTIQTSPPPLPESEPLSQLVLNGLLPAPVPEATPIHTLRPKMAANGLSRSRMKLGRT